MAKIYTPKRFELKEVGLKLLNKTFEEICIIKAQEYSKITLPSNFSLRGYDIEIIKQPTHRHKVVSVSIEASRDGEKFFVDNPLEFGNPLTMVFDGTFHKTIDPHSGKEVDQPNLVEDLVEAMKEMIVEVVDLAYRGLI